MNIQIERLKEKSIQFSIPLVQKRLSDDLITELIDTDDKFKESKILFKDVETKDDLRMLKECLEQSKSKIQKDIFDDCTEELIEIAEDYRWSNSKEGKTILKLEDWITDARNQIAQIEDFKTIFIGRDYLEPTTLIISGVTEGEVQEKELKKKIEQLNPPTIPKYFIERPE